MQPFEALDKNVQKNVQNDSKKIAFYIFTKFAPLMQSNIQISIFNIFYFLRFQTFSRKIKKDILSIFQNVQNDFRMRFCFSGFFKGSNNLTC